MDRFCLRSAALAGLAAAIALALPAPLAQAAEAITGSNITTPANPSFVLHQAGEKLKVSGTVVRKAGGVEEAVNINCYYETPAGEIEEDCLWRKPSPWHTAARAGPSRTKSNSR